MQKEQIVAITKSIFIAIISIIIISGGAALYVHKVNTSQKSELANYILEIASHEADTFDQEIKIERQALSAMATAIGEYEDLISLNRLLTLLDFENNRNDFKQMGIIMPGNKAYFNDLSMSDKFLPKMELLDVWGGESKILGDVRDPQSGEMLIVQVVPIYMKGKVRALLFATQTPRYYANILARSKFSGKGMSYVITRNGRIIIGPEGEPAGNVYDWDQTSILDGKDMDDMKFDISQGKNDVINYSRSGQLRFLSFSPLKINDWYLLFSVPSDLVAQKANYLIKLSLILCAVILIVFCGLIFYILKLQKAGREAFFNMAFTDPLTDAKNLSKFRLDMPDILESHLSSKFALVAMDINKFKVINDLYGQRQGDMVLVHTANILREYLKPYEIFARVGADIFVFLISYTQEKEITDTINKIEKGIKNCYASTDPLYTLSSSFGIYKIEEELPFYSMLDRANIAKTSAKKDESKTYDFYEETDRKKILTEKAMENNMHKALEETQFVVYYQPKYDFKTSQITGAEALVRWIHPKKGLIDPDNFIPVFEKNGFIIQLDMFILEETAKKIRYWIDNGIKTVPISINFSRMHLTNPNYLGDFKAIADKYKIPASLIELELTESAVFSNIAKIKSFITALHILGFSIAMDDFGSGYSSLNVLKNLPFDTLKLDKEFLKDCEDNERARSIIEGTVKMLKTLNAQIVAEGVETKAQADFLSAIGCDLAQGYLFSKPLQTQDFEILLKNLKNN